MTGLVEIFVVGSLLLSTLFLYTAIFDLWTARAGSNHNDHDLRQAASYVQRRALLGGALSVNRLFWIVVIMWQFFPWSDAVYGPYLLLGVWILNESITLWGWYKTR